jgi:hypothetical protein
VTVIIIWIISLVMLLLSLFNNGARFFDFMDRYQRTHVHVQYDWNDTDSTDTDTIAGFPGDLDPDSTACPADSL